MVKILLWILWRKDYKYYSLFASTLNDYFWSFKLINSANKCVECKCKAIDWPDKTLALCIDCL